MTQLLSPVTGKLTRFALAGILSAFLMQAQTSARITGVVKDQNGQAIADAAIEAVGQKSAEKRKLASDKDGAFSLADLPPDVYQISASCSTCSDTSKIVEVGAGQSRSVELDLDTSSSSSVISMDNHATTLDASSPKLGMNVAAAEIAALPVNGRTFAPLALTAPFVTNAGGANFQDLHYAGQAAEQNRYLLDGVDASSVISSAPGYLPISGNAFRLRNSLDTVDEFRVDSVGYAPEDGGATGSQVKLVSKSGTDEWHGSLFEYFRNDKLQARNYFDGSQTNELRMNQFGGNAGGAILKDKLFIFGSAEELKQRTGFDTFELTPSMAARDRADASVLPLLDLIPMGIQPTSDPDIDTAERKAVAAQDESNENFRVDYLPSPKHRLFLRYSRAAGDLLTPDDTTTNRNIAASSKPEQTMLSWNYQINNSFINQVAIALNRAPITVNVLAPGAANDDSRFLVGQESSGGYVSPGGLVQLADGLYADHADYRGRTYNAQDNLTWMKGSHSLQMGVETRLIRVPFSTEGGLTYSVRNIDSLLSNDDVDVTYYGDLPNRLAAQEEYAGYVQDQWRVSSEVQAVFGVRYDYFGAMREQDNRATLFNIDTLTSTAANGGFYNASKTNFQPRAGLTWSPKRLKGDTVVRIGAGMYDGPTSVMDAIWPIENSAPSAFVPGVSYPQSQSSILNSSNAILTPRALDTSNFGEPQQNYLFTASVQQALPHQFVAQAGYVGILSRHLVQESVANLSAGVDPLTGDTLRANELYSDVPFLTKGGNSSYNGLQLGLNRHLVDNLTFSASYNLSHSIGDAQGSGEELPVQDPLCLACERGDNSFDVRQSFSANTIYSLPFGKGQRHLANGWTGNVLGGWTVAGTWNARTGLPIDVMMSRSDEIYYDPASASYLSPSADLPATAYAVVNAPYGLESVGAFRPNVVPGVNPYLKNQNGLTWLNPAAFSTPLPGTFGDLGRNALRGPGFSQVDFQLSRRFAVTEHQALEMKVEAFNLFNHANFSNPTLLLPDSTIDTQPGTAYSNALAAGFGTLNSTVGRTVGLGTSRQLQLSARFEF